MLTTVRAGSDHNNQPTTKQRPVGVLPPRLVVVQPNTSKGGVRRDKNVVWLHTSSKGGQWVSVDTRRQR